jgi:hypothetical protein
MCDYIRNENIKSIIEHIVTKHLCQKPSSTDMSDATMKITPSLEDVATPYVDTLTLLRRKYEENVNATKVGKGESSGSNAFDNDSQRIMQSAKAREDQVRKRQFVTYEVKKMYFHYFRYPTHKLTFLFIITGHSANSEKPIKSQLIFLMTWKNNHMQDHRHQHLLLLVHHQGV